MGANRDAGAEEVLACSGLRNPLTFSLLPSALVYDGVWEQITRLLPDGQALWREIDRQYQVEILPFVYHREFGPL